MTRQLATEHGRLVDERERLLVELRALEAAIRECEAEEHDRRGVRYVVTEHGPRASW